jgi:hypothetical protein
MNLTAAVDPEDPLAWRFHLADAPADAELDYGDGASETIEAGRQDFEHAFERSDTFRVVAVSAGQTAETYVTTSEPPSLPLQLLSLSPPSAEVGGADASLNVFGQGFEPGCVVVFKGEDSETAYVSDTQVTTIVKPVLALEAGVVPVLVRNADGGYSNELSFEFTQAPSPEEVR